jgi:hypothetical protein
LIESGIEFADVTFTAPAGSSGSLGRFYGTELGLHGGIDGEGRLALGVGASQLRFAEVSNDSRPFYHFAVLVPGDRFDAGREWAGAQAELLPDPDNGDTTFDFSNWDALACYFHDPVGNIVELISHRGIGEGRASGGTFSPAELLAISEIGLVGPDVTEMAHDLARLGLAVWDGDASAPDDLAFVGRRAHTLILTPVGRGWLPTRRPAELHPVDLTLRGANPGELSIAGAAHHVRSNGSDR